PNLLETSIGDFFTGVIEFRSFKRNFYMLPKTRSARCVPQWRMPLIPFFSLRPALVPALVYSSDITKSWILNAPTIQQLHLITAHPIDPRIRSPWHQEIQFQIQIVMLPLRKNMTIILFSGYTYQDAVSLRCPQVVFNPTITFDLFRNLPVACYMLERLQIVKLDGVHGKGFHLKLFGFRLGAKGLDKR